MSQITIKDIEKIARLARIEVLDQEKSALASQMNSIVGWMESLNEVNTDNVEVLASVNDIALNMDQDVIADGNITEEVLKNSPAAKYNYFTVPKVIE